ncbi:unnamed protein product [Blepharisma stoltei]|uniref:Uncharacterized protein n=1 Tax=Blepharisma stoltei TaxID=1481888 RepID=A0AAU9JAE2_9CILI|nr:unnamed protein product [Blepharisma stoltei]
MKPEIWELTHRLWGIEISIYDMCIIAFNLLMVIFAALCFAIACCEKKESMQGNYQTNGYANIGDTGNLKAFKIGGQAGPTKRKSTFRIPSNKNIKEDISCSVCGIGLVFSSQIG